VVRWDTQGGFFAASCVEKNCSLLLVIVGMEMEFNQWARFLISRSTPRRGLVWSKLRFLLW
jgi:hypothetical protein